ncbi:MAG: ABC transporter permease, partial [Bifidobacterium tibiigranuli]|nr:ABC transporter permease [Bifidobacterium tibiigranuli]
MNDTIDILRTNLGKALTDTAYMVAVSTVIGVVLGTLVALLLYVTRNRLFLPNRTLNAVVGVIVNAIRSLPFLILMVVLIP